MKVDKPPYRLLTGCCEELLRELDDASVHMVVTDPPYYIDGMGDDWDHEKLEGSASKAGVIGGLPVGMKFDPSQGRRLQEFMSPVAAELYRVLKPGGFCIAFSQARLYHRMAMAFEDQGFEMRDMLAWKYEGQAKAFSQDHFVRRMAQSGKISERRAQELVAQLQGRKTPQLKPQLEPMCLAQKPKTGTFVQNWCEHGVGLMDTQESLTGKFPGNCMEVPKPSREERGENPHMTVKPVALIAHLIRLFSQEGQCVLDPFCGSGSHGVAAVTNGRLFIGIEKEPAYMAVAAKRLKECSCVQC